MVTLLGHERTGARLFGAVFKPGIEPAWAIFKGRSMHPPQDNVNAVLSFLYTLILFRVDAALENAGLDPYAGFYHRIDYGKKSLAYDLMEEFRTPLADTLTSALFNMDILKPEDFRKVTFNIDDQNYPLSEGEDGSEEETSIPTTQMGVLLTSAGVKKVIAQFERKLNDGIYYAQTLSKVLYKKVFFKQAKHFRRVLGGEESEYKPLRIK
jgi:CRISPR-associated protein Cas1